jgi:hypothetical protein
MVSGAVVSGLLLVFSEMGWISLGWTWIPLINTAMTFVIASSFRSDVPLPESTKERVL